MTKQIFGITHNIHDTTHSRGIGYCLNAIFLLRYPRTVIMRKTTQNLWISNRVLHHALDQMIFSVGDIMQFSHSCSPKGP